ncbi:MAG: glutaredoxin family protein [Gallionellaceae bacterium]
MKNILLLAGLLFAMSCVQAGEYYRGTNQSGKVKYYGDQPPTSEDVVFEKKVFKVAPDPKNSDMPYETRIAHERFPVTLYTSNNCKDKCKSARDFLNNRGIPFAEKLFSSQRAISDFEDQSGSDAIPTLGVGNNYFPNFSAKRWNSELSIAKYPKVAPYQANRTAKPAEEIQQDD